MSPEAAPEMDAGPLDPADVQALLASDFWVRIEGGGPTGSTNDDARALAAEGAPEGTVVLASEQRAGRGRFARVWDSPEGGVYFSVVVRPVKPSASAGALPLAIGLGVVLGLERLGVSPRLKWPNDVLVRGGKVAGVLVEARASGAGAGLPSEQWAVAGVGLNLRRSAESGADAQGAIAGFLADDLPGVTRAVVAAAALDGMAHAYLSFADGGFDRIRQDYERRSVTLGRDVVVTGANGEAIASGQAVGVDADGRLLVSTDDGRGGSRFR